MKNRLLCFSFLFGIWLRRERKIQTEKRKLPQTHGGNIYLILQVVNSEIWVGG